jgi:hypothetical protein
MTAPLFKAHLYDKDRVWECPVGAFESIEGTLRYDNISDLEITVKSTHKRLGLMLTPGTRLGLFLRDEWCMGGPIRSHQGEGPGKSTSYTFGVEDNYRVLRNFLVYPVPTQPVTNQVGATNYTVSGDMETVFKDVVSKNLIRGPEPIIIATNQHRGGTVNSSARMATVYNELFPLLESKGLGAQVLQTPAGLIIDVYEPGVYPNKLTEASRVIRKWKYKLEAPDATRVVVGGDGQGAARNFIERSDTAAEALWGDRIEVFRDARDVTTLATMQERGDETLFDARGSVSITCELAETDSFRLGGVDGLKVGQIVTAEIGDGAVTVTDILRQIDFSYNADDGLKLKAEIGQPINPTAKLMKHISKLAMSVDKLKASY